MAINITDGFNLNYAAPVDYRMVVANSTARLALTYKYDGLKVFQLDTRVSYIWNPSGSGNWNIESYDKISGTGSTNYIPKFTGTNSTTGSWEIGNSPISASGSNVGINTNNQRGSYTYLQIGGTSLTEDPYWFAGQSLPLTIHKGGTAIIGYNWYWTGSANAYFNSAVGSSQILFSDNSMSFKTRPGSGSFVYNMIIYPGYVIFSDDIPSGSTKSPMIRSQGSTSYSSQTTPDFTWWNNDQTGIFRPSANTIAFTNNGTESVRIESNGVFKLSSNGTVSDPVFSFVSSPTTGIFRPSANTIAFTNNGTESVRITASGSVGIGVSPTTIHSSANLFNSSIPKLEVLVGNSMSNYQELMVLRGLKGSATNDLTRVGVIMKLSDETGSGESDKMGGMILESTTQYSNYPSLHLVTSNQKRLGVTYNGEVSLSSDTYSTMNNSAFIGSGSYSVSSSGSTSALVKYLTVPSSSSIIVECTFIGRLTPTGTGIGSPSSWYSNKIMSMYDVSSIGAITQTVTAGGATASFFSGGNSYSTMSGSTIVYPGYISTGTNLIQFYMSGTSPYSSYTFDVKVLYQITIV